MKTRELVYQAIVDHIDEHGIAPTIREIQTAIGASSSSVIAYHLNALESEGKVTRRKERAQRQIQLSGVGPKTVLAGKVIAAKIAANAVFVDGGIDMVVDGALILELQRWASEVAA